MVGGRLGHTVHIPGRLRWCSSLTRGEGHGAGVRRWRLPVRARRVRRRRSPRHDRARRARRGVRGRRSQRPGHSRRRADASGLAWARYNHLKPQGLASYEAQFPRLNIQFKTVHSAKGLEADYVIVLNVESGWYGFPSTITDDPLLHLVIPRPETFPHAEERRLLYVAITRAKRAVFLLANTARKSIFATEIAEMDGVSDLAGFARSNPCPDCTTGDLRIRTGPHGQFFGCSNYPDCTYSRNVTSNQASRTQSNETCPGCGSGTLKVRIRRRGGHGSFLGCSKYPSCRYTRNL